MSESVRMRLATGFAKAVDTASIGDVEAYVSRGVGLPVNRARLLAWDANSVHGIVFDTTNATAIRGTSYLLKELDMELQKGKALGLDSSQILFAGGGSGLAVVSDEQAQAATVLLHKLFAEQTFVGTCSVASVELGSGDRPFNEIYAACQDRLSRDRALRGYDAEPAVPFFALRCGVCGRRAASSVVETRIGGPRPECLVCHHAIEHGKGSRRDNREVTDFEEIADEVRGGFLAVVYLDGNGIGRRISELTSPLAYAMFSRAIDRLVVDSFHELAGDYGLVEEGMSEEGKRLRGHAHQLPICGGDDLVAILPGDIAVPFTRDLLRRVEEKADQDSELEHRNFSELDPIGAAAGVAIGKVGFPIRHLIQEAEALLESAKERCYGPRRVRSALDFAEVADGAPRRESMKPDRLRKEVPKMLSTGRPYSLPELQTFSSRFRAVRDAKIGRSQLYNLRRYADAGPAQLRNHTLYQIGRRDDWRTLIEVLAGDSSAVLDKDRAVKEVVPDYDEHAVFDVGDMLELYDHWREAKEGASP